MARRRNADHRRLGLGKKATEQSLPGEEIADEIADMADRSLWSPEPVALQEEIKTLALRYNLMSAFTAFVAVDSSRVTEGDHGYSVSQPVPVPKGVRYDTTVDPAE